MNGTLKNKILKITSALMLFLLAVAAECWGFSIAADMLNLADNFSVASGAFLIVVLVIAVVFTALTTFQVIDAILKTKGDSDAS